MLRRRRSALSVLAAAIAVTVSAMFAAPTAAAPAGGTPLTAARMGVTVPTGIAALPDTSATMSHPGSADIALAAVPHIPAAIPGPAKQAAAAAPSIVPPWLSDQYCSYNGVQLTGINSACLSATLGTYDPYDNCFWKTLQPPPPPGDPLWQGQSSSPPAALYSVTCMTHFGPNVGNAAATIVYSTQPPLNYGQPPLSNLQLAALNLFVTVLALAPVPPVGTEPANDVGISGLPTWMWLDVPPAFWDQKVISVTLFLNRKFTKVSLSFQGQQVDWDMGDGHHVICTTPGTAYTKPPLPNLAYKVYSGAPGPSPDCGYQYAMVGQFPVSATATWLIAFQVGSSTSGTFVISKTTAAMMMSIGELQVVTE